MTDPIPLITDENEPLWWLKRRDGYVSPFEDFRQPPRDEPEVRWRSEHLRVWHIGHWWRVGGCLRWVTELTVQGSERHITVYGRHLEP